MLLIVYKELMRILHSTKKDNLIVKIVWIIASIVQVQILAKIVIPDSSSKMQNVLVNVTQDNMVTISRRSVWLVDLTVKLAKELLHNVHLVMQMLLTRSWTHWQPLVLLKINVVMDMFKTYKTELVLNVAIV